MPVPQQGDVYTSFMHSLFELLVGRQEGAQFEESTRGSGHSIPCPRGVESGSNLPVCRDEVCRCAQENSRLPFKWFPVAPLMSSWNSGLAAAVWIVCICAVLFGRCVAQFSAPSGHVPPGQIFTSGVHSAQAHHVPGASDAMFGGSGAEMICPSSLDFGPALNDGRFQNSYSEPPAGSMGGSKPRKMMTKLALRVVPPPSPNLVREAPPPHCLNRFPGGSHL